MTTLELKTAIHQAVDQVPEGVLPELLDYINSIKQPLNDEDFKRIAGNIFEEDAEVLRRLAE